MLTVMRLTALLEDKQPRFQKYRLSEQDAWTIFDRQAGLCPICGDDLPEEFHIDHDHATGGVRGFLCPVCNTARVGANTLLTAKRLVHYLENEQLGVPDPCYSGVMG